MKKLEKFANREISSEIQRKIKGGNQCCVAYAINYCEYAWESGIPYYWQSCYDTVMWACNYIPSAFDC